MNRTQQIQYLIHVLLNEMCRTTIDIGQKNKKG